MQSVLPAPLVGLFFLGIWACALGWAAPCQFSGATSLGRDVMTALRPHASGADIVRYTKWALVLLTGLMILFGVLRSEQSAWWNIRAWTARNSATFAPVLAVLLWQGATRSAAVTSMVVGFAVGMLWYQLSGWGIANFLYGIHPVWLGMSANIVVLVLVSLLTTPTGWDLSLGTLRPIAWFPLAGGLGLAVVTYATFGALQPTGLPGLFVFLAALSLSVGLMLLLRPREEPAPLAKGTVPATPT
jgi:SSS family solute:Na+ symporter